MNFIGEKLEMTSVDCFIEAEKAMQEYDQCYKAIYLKKALALYSLAITKNNTYGEAYYKRAQVYGLLEHYEIQHKDLDTAIKIFEEELSKNPDNQETLLNLGITYRQHYSLKYSIERAWYYFNKVSEMDPTNAKAAFQLADILKYEKREYAAAIKYYDIAIQFAETNTDYYLERGECFAHLRQFDHALADYEKGVSLKPEDWRFYNRRGELYMQLAQWEEARMDYQKYRKYTPYQRHTPLISLEKNIGGGPYIELYFAADKNDNNRLSSNIWYLEDSIFIEFYRCFAPGIPKFSIYGEFEYSLNDIIRVKALLMESLAGLNKILGYGDFIDRAIETRFISTLIRHFDDWEINWEKWLQQLKDIYSSLIYCINDAIGSGKKLYFYGI
jgi:tetratricopeptide (TPR) repeat protein